MAYKPRADKPEGMGAKRGGAKKAAKSAPKKATKKR
jgi:hypothetical protein